MIRFLWGACVLMPSLLLAQPVPRYGILITEIFADPTPSAGLPAGEYVEIKNTLPYPVSIDHWILTDGNSRALIPSGTDLLPDSFLVLCARNNQDDYQPLGRTLGLSGFPALDNDGDQLVLQSAQGMVIHAVAFDRSWHSNALKDAGGWSLEMIDPGLPCAGKENWSSSLHPSGGTPGRANSLSRPVADYTAPHLLRTYMRDSLTVIAVFDESLDSLSSADPSRYRIEPGLGHPLRVQVRNPMLCESELSLSRPLSPQQICTLEVRDIADCQGNSTQEKQSAKIALSHLPAPGDLRINEIRFNPRPEESDYIELLLTGPHAIDLSALYLGNTNSAGQTADLVQVCPSTRMLYPGEFLVITADTTAIRTRFPAADPRALLLLNPMPSYPDDEGFVVLTDRQGLVMEKFHYLDKFHFPLLVSTEGVSLERINPLGEVNDPGNWYSAAATSQFGTPTYRNSQYRDPGLSTARFSVEPRIFSPDQDGQADQVLIAYRFTEPGNLCSIRIFDAAGRPVRQLVRQATCALEGHFLWEGLDDKKSRLPAGIYIMVCESFHPSGRSSISKQSIVLAYRQ